MNWNKDLVGKTADEISMLTPPKVFRELADEATNLVLKGYSNAKLVHIHGEWNLDGELIIKIVRFRQRSEEW